jgi:hypothetical protein
LTLVEIFPKASKVTKGHRHVLHVSSPLYDL